MLIIKFMKNKIKDSWFPGYVGYSSADKEIKRLKKVGYNWMKVSAIITALFVLLINYIIGI